MSRSRPVYDCFDEILVQHRVVDIDQFVTVSIIDFRSK